jgi:hypothetical protein
VKIISAKMAFISVLSLYFIGMKWTIKKKIRTHDVSSESISNHSDVCFTVLHVSVYMWIYTAEYMTYACIIYVHICVYMHFS